MWLVVALFLGLSACAEAPAVVPPPPGAELAGLPPAVAPPVLSESPDPPDPPGDAPFPIPDWPVSDPTAHGFDPAGLEEASLIADEQESYCLLVIRGGEIVFERYYRGHDATTPERSWSIAKSYSSALVGIALSRGDFPGIETPVADYITDWQGSARESITLRHLLSMTSGLEWSVWDDYVSMVAFSSDHSEHALGLQAAQDPGVEWRYHNGAVQVFEPLFRAATGVTIEAYAQEHLWSRLGMTATWAHDRSGNPTAYASVMASCRDHARMGYLYLRGGRWGDEQVVPEAWVEETLSPSQEMNRAYGYLWWLNGETPALDAMSDPYEEDMAPFAPDDLFAMRGLGNQFVDVIPSLDLMVVRFGTDPFSTFDPSRLAEDQRFSKHDLILGAVLDAMTE
jgi:CubicO group peptidase (beta-lactamase class C family)